MIDVNEMALTIREIERAEAINAIREGTKTLIEVSELTGAGEVRMSIAQLALALATLSKAAGLDREDAERGVQIAFDMIDKASETLNAA